MDLRGILEVFEFSSFGWSTRGLSKSFVMFNYCLCYSSLILIKSSSFFKRPSLSKGIFVSVLHITNTSNLINSLYKSFHTQPSLVCPTTLPYSSFFSTKALPSSLAIKKLNFHCIPEHIKRQLLFSQNIHP